jgi:methylated-DNA-[protein]-cysteine S-methyltransferase
MIARAGATPFLKRVYEAVVEIPPGETKTYAEVAELARRPGAARAVGAAMARNPFAPLIPCHRVVGSDGRLTGYGGGLDMKRQLLEMEGADA